LAKISHRDRVTFEVQTFMRVVFPMFNRFFNKDKKKTQEDDDASSKSQPDTGFANLTADKLKAVIASLTRAEAIFIKAGYRMEQLDVEFGNTTKLTPHFKQLESINQQQHDDLLAALEDQQLIKFILISLNKSSRMQSLFDNSELYYYGMEIDISSTPSVRTVFKRKESMAEVIPIKPDL
jgi:hypothetical protein